MDKLHCWRATIDRHRFVFFVHTQSLGSAKRVAQAAGVPAPKQSDLVGVSPNDREFRTVEYLRDTLYWADEEDFPLAYRRGNRSSIEDWIRTGGHSEAEAHG